MMKRFATSVRPAQALLRLHRALNVLAAGGVLLVVVFLGYLYLTSPSPPPDWVDDIGDYVQWQEARLSEAERSRDDRFRVFSVSGQDYVAVFGPRALSGSAVAVFERSGALVDWTLADGDDEAWWSDWGDAYRGRIATRAEALGGVK